VEAATRIVGVLGTGTMGAGIAQIVSQAGYRVIACDRGDRVRWKVNAEELGKAEAAIEAVVERVEREKLPPRTRT
jgi:3-hydroxybutyryl-CoA dehydrogenase